MHAIGGRGYAAYVDYLEVHPEEFGLLFDTILINVTAFFRDPPAWESLRRRGHPARILAGKGQGEPIRVWSAGCASGEEAYTLAMVLAEALGSTPFRERVKIYATDVDEEALAGPGWPPTTPERSRASRPTCSRNTSSRSATGYAFHKELRRAVIFGRHDLIQDAPISRIDLLVCRNTLMYFNAETQARILEPVPLRAERRRLPVPGQGRDAR